VTEHRLQTGIYAFLRLALPPDAFVTSIDHARQQSEQSGMRQKARGVRAGIPDMLILYRGEAFWLEVKTPDGRLTESQKALHSEIVRAGGHVEVVRSVSGAEHAFCLTGEVPAGQAESAGVMDPDILSALKGRGSGSAHHAALQMVPASSARLRGASTGSDAPSARRRMLMAAFVSAFAANPHAAHSNLDCEGRLPASTTPHAEHVRLVFCAGTSIRCAPRSAWPPANTHCVNQERKGKQIKIIS